MARNPRFAPPGYWLHLTQGGDGQQEIFRHDGDRRKYLELLAVHAKERQIQVLGYCLMSNHVHLIALGKYPEAISQWMRDLNGHYAQRMQTLEERRGRFWQHSFSSCALDEHHLRAALLYAELNPVRHGLVTDASAYPWSSAASHTGQTKCAPFLNQHEFGHRYYTSDWRLALAFPQPPSDVAAIRLATRLGQPLGSPEFLAHLEAEFDVVLPRTLVAAKTMRASA